MPLTINGVPHPDGAPLLIGGVQADEVTVNGTRVWVNNYAPSQILDFAATDDEDDQVTVTFSLADAVPPATYALYEDNVEVAAGISSGYVHSKLGPFTGTYKVRATNIVGSVDSNTDSGTALYVFVPILDTMSTGAIGETQGNHVMDSGHRWTPGNDPVATIYSYGSSAGGRGLRAGLESGTTYESSGAGVIIPIGDYPDNIRVVQRFDFDNGLAIYSSIVVQGDNAGVSVNFVDSTVSTDPSTLGLLIDGVNVQDIIMPDSTPSNYIIMTTDIVDGIANVSVNFNGSVYNFNAHATALVKAEVISWAIDSFAIGWQSINMVSEVSVTEL